MHPIHVIKAITCVIARSTIAVRPCSSIQAATLALLLGITSTASAQTIFTDDFESGDMSQTMNEARWVYGTNTNVTSAIARSGDYSLRFVYTAGGQAGDYSWSEQRFALGRQMTDVWLRWYQYFPAGDEGLGPRWYHRSRSDVPDNNKLLRLWDNDYSNYNIKAGFSYLPAGNGDSTIVPKFGTDGGGVGDWGLEPAVGVINESARGRWVEFIAHVKVDDGLGNGVLDLWIDGSRVLQNVLSMLPSLGEGNYFQYGYLMGWANSGFDQTSYTYIDDFIISDSPIEPGSSPPEAPTDVIVQ